MSKTKLPENRQFKALRDGWEEYPCFNYNIRYYEMAHLFNIEPKSNGSKLSRIVPKLSWGFVFFMSIALTMNTASLFRKYFASDKQVFGTEIFQRCYEVLLGPLFIIDMLIFLIKLYPLMKEMRETFDTSEETVVQQCIQSEKRTFYTSVIAANVVIFMSYFRKIFLGLSEDELVETKYYYNKAHPEKQLPMVFWLPFDDTVPPNYYIMVVLNIYALILTSILATGLISNTSVFSIHIRGQYQMIALQLNRAKRAGDLKTIIQKHQRILLFREKLQAVLSSTCLLKTFIYTLTLTLSLYQLSSLKEVNQRAFQLVFQWAVILIMFYSLTTSSEVIDEGNDILYTAIRSYKWYSIKNFSKNHTKCFNLFAKMSGKPMRLIYYGGTVDICYRSFLTVIRFSYSSFTLLKQSLSNKR